MAPAAGPATAAWRCSCRANESPSATGTTRFNDTSFPLRAGVEYHPNPDLRLLSEVQVGVSDELRDDVALTLGVLFPF